MSPVFERAASVVARHTGVSRRKILARRAALQPPPRDDKGRLQGGRAQPAQIAFARQAAIYLAIVSSDLPVRRFVREVGVHREVVRRALAAIEDRRDEREIDELLTKLEQEVAA
jgi:hypothetical protein